MTNNMKCENCGKKIPAWEDRYGIDPKNDAGTNIPFVWWTPEEHYACSEECYRVKYLGCEPSKKAKKVVCPDCRALRARCSVHLLRP